MRLLLKSRVYNREGGRVSRPTSLWAWGSYDLCNDIHRLEASVLDICGYVEQLMQLLCDDVLCFASRSCLLEKVNRQWLSVLNSVILQVTKAISLYSDRDRCHSLTFLLRQLTCKAQ